jgi:hypothetical protein
VTIFSQRHPQGYVSVGDNASFSRKERGLSDFLHFHLQLATRAVGGWFAGDDDPSRQRGAAATLPPPTCAATRDGALVVRRVPRATSAHRSGVESSPCKRATRFGKASWWIPAKVPRYGNAPSNESSPRESPCSGGRCGREDLNLQGACAPPGPKPGASASSATPAAYPIVVVGIARARSSPGSKSACVVNGAV